MIPEIKNDNYYLIKTNNGKFYQDFIAENCVTLHNIPLETEDAVKLKQLKQFQHETKIGDRILIPDYRNKFLSIGRIVSNAIIDKDQVFKKVMWEKIVKIQEFDFKFRQFLSSHLTIVKLNEIALYLDRLVYPIFFKQKRYHFIMKVNQEANILAKSLYGLVQIIESENVLHDLEVRLSLHSPGVIEFITEHMEFLVIMLKMIQLIQTIRKDHIHHTNEEKAFIERNKTIIEKYYEYEVDKLQLDVTNYTINHEDLTDSMSTKIIQ